MIPGLFVPLHFRSRERKDHKENFRSRGTFVPWNIRSLVLSLLGSEGSKNFRSVELSLPWNFRSSGANVPRTFVPMKLSYHENEYFENFRSKCPKTRPINLTIAKVPWNESSWNIRSWGAKVLQKRKFHRTKVFGLFAPRERGT